MSTQLLTAYELVGGYGAIDILHGVSLSVGVGEIVTVIGPNGAGKSTAFKTIVGFLRPKSGRVVFSGEEITGVRHADLRQARGDEARRVHVDAGRAERGARARERRPRLRAGARAKPLRGAGDRAAGRSGGQASVPRRLRTSEGGSAPLPMPPPGSVAPAEPALERWRVQHLRRRVEAVARYSGHAHGPEEVGVVVVVAPLAAAPLFPGAFPRRSALAPPAIEDHLGGVALAETPPEELAELGPLRRHDIEVTTRRGHGDKRRRFAPNLPEALPWEAMRPRPRREAR